MKGAGAGSIVPVYKAIDIEMDAVEYFARLSDYGRKQNSILLESSEFVRKYGEQSIGSANPCLKVLGRGAGFEISALNALGRRFLQALHAGNDFGFCENVKYRRDSISGTLRAHANSALSESERLRQKTHADILRKIAFKFHATQKPFAPYGGLFGAISYDFIDQFEELPKNRKDLLNEPDYELLFLDNLFMISHAEKKLYLVANALLFDDDFNGAYEKCLETIADYEKALSAEIPEKRSFKKTEKRVSSDTSRKEFIAIVNRMKQHILRGDIFQAVPSRTIITNYAAEPLDIYAELRRLNPSPYMFYFAHSSGILLGASPELCLKVSGNERKTAQIRPIAGTKPRGFANGRIDADLDSRYEAELKTDRKELAEHAMLVDLARNDIARISDAGTRSVSEAFVVEKYSHVQHLVSNVLGVLRKDLDALHAYLASMNMGTLTGAPKIEAMKLLRKYEKTRRGFYGGAVCYFTPSADFDSTIIIRSLQLKGGKACARAGAGIVHDSIAEREFEETEKKAKAALRAIELAESGGSQHG